MNGTVGSTERSHPWFAREACRGNRLIYAWCEPGQEAFWQVYGAEHDTAEQLQAWRANPEASPDDYGRTHLYIFGAVCFEDAWPKAEFWMRTGNFIMPDGSIRVYEEQPATPT